MINLIHKAKDFAILKHKDQTYGDYPYSYHLDEVYNMVCEAGLNDNFKIVNGTMMTIHSYTNDQRILDSTHAST